MADSTPSTASNPAEGSIRISIRAPADQKLSVTIDKSATVLQLKQQISELDAFKSDPCEPSTQRLIYSGRVLKDDDKLSTYKIADNNVVHLVRSAKKPEPPPPAAQVPQNINAGQQFAGNPLSPLMNSDLVTRAGGLAGINPFGGMGINQNDPNFLQNMMNSPQMRQQMESVMSNPEVIDSIIQSSPELRALGPQARVIMQSPLFRQMITNPDMMRTAMEMRGFGGAPNNGQPQPGLFGLAQQQQQQQTQGGNATPTTAAPGMESLFNNANLAAMLGGGQPTAAGEAGTNTSAAPSLAQLQALFGGGGGGGFGPNGGAGAGFNPFANFAQPQAPADPRPPEERFESQLGSLREMGFTNAQQNVRALMATGGNVEAAIEYILGGGAGSGAAW